MKVKRDVPRKAGSRVVTIQLKNVGRLNVSIRWGFAASAGKARLMDVGRW